MSRVLSLSMTEELYNKASKHASGQGLTVYQYVRQAIETKVSSDDYTLKMLSLYDEYDNDDE